MSTRKNVRLLSAICGFLICGGIATVDNAKADDADVLAECVANLVQAGLSPEIACASCGAPDQQACVISTKAALLIDELQQLEFSAPGAFDEIGNAVGGKAPRR